MASVRRIEVVWQGLTGLPGLSVFHSLDSVSGALAAIRAFFLATQSLYPSGLTLSFPNSGDVFDSATGTLTGGWSDTAVANVPGSGAGAYAAGVGMFVKWNTGAIVGGRRLKGRTFLCPLGNDRYDAGGTIVDGSVTTVQTAANTLVATGTMNVWHRPTSPGGSDGALHVVTSATPLDKVTALRSRRV